MNTRSGKNAGGTWVSPQLTIPFARWLNVDLAGWCDDQIEQLLTARHLHLDWKRARHQTTATFKTMKETLRSHR